MPRADVVQLTPDLRDAAPSIIPVLISTLGAKKTFVRQAAALILAALDARDALNPLVRLLGTEPSAIWEEVARAVAAFGTPARTALLDAVAREALTYERAALALAFSVAHEGDRSALDALARDPDGERAHVAALARTEGPRVERLLSELAPGGKATGPREFGRRIGLALVG